MTVRVFNFAKARPFVDSKPSTLLISGPSLRKLTQLHDPKPNLCIPSEIETKYP